MSIQTRISLFEAFGIELEYMLVDRDTLNVCPVADRVLETAAGEPTSDIECGPVTWSNELALHVIELKCTRPARDLPTLAQHFQQGIENLQSSLVANGVQMLPTGMHPWMDPTTETQLWPHENAEIYEAYHRVFDCYAHGWANVQSVHLNLPFASNEQFGPLHAAVRLLLPILPALTASSPIMERRRGEWLDTRMRMVRDHCEEIPFLTGKMVPEAIFDEATYRGEIFARLKKEIEPYDPDCVFDANFLNARGAIARFDRGSIELRVMDVQEYPMADVAVCVAAIAALKTLVDGHWTSYAEQKTMSTNTLANLLDNVSAEAEGTVIAEPKYLKHFGLSDSSLTAGELWQHILQEARSREPMLESFQTPLETILTQGSLATRIAKTISEDFRMDRLREVYRHLGNCLVEGTPFLP